MVWLPHISELKLHSQCRCLFLKTSENHRIVWLIILKTVIKSEFHHSLHRPCVECLVIFKCCQPGIPAEHKPLYQLFSCSLPHCQSTASNTHLYGNITYVIWWMLVYLIVLECFFFSTTAQRGEAKAGPRAQKGSILADDAELLISSSFNLNVPFNFLEEVLNISL